MFSLFFSVPSMGFVSNYWCRPSSSVIEDEQAATIDITQKDTNKAQSLQLTECATETLESNSLTSVETDLTEHTGNSEQNPLAERVAELLTTDSHTSYTNVIKLTGTSEQYPLANSTTEHSVADLCTISNEAVSTIATTGSEEHPLLTASATTSENASNQLTGNGGANLLSERDAETSPSGPDSNDEETPIEHANNEQTEYNTILNVGNDEQYPLISQHPTPKYNGSEPDQPFDKQDPLAQDSKTTNPCEALALKIMCGSCSWCANGSDDESDAATAGGSEESCLPTIIEKMCRVCNWCVEYGLLESSETAISEKAGVYEPVETEEDDGYAGGDEDSLYGDEERMDAGGASYMIEFDISAEFEAWEEYEGGSDGGEEVVDDWEDDWEDVDEDDEVEEYLEEYWAIPEDNEEVFGSGVKRGVSEVKSDEEVVEARYVDWSVKGEQALTAWGSSGSDATVTGDTKAAPALVAPFDNRPIDKIEYDDDRTVRQSDYADSDDGTITLKSEEERKELEEETKIKDLMLHWWIADLEDGGWEEVDENWEDTSCEGRVGVEHYGLAIWAKDRFTDLELGSRTRVVLAVTTWISEVEGGWEYL